MKDKPQIRFPAEWEPQSGVQLTWPHADTDWREMLDEVVPCFVAIAKEIVRCERLLIVCPDAAAVRRQLGVGVDSGRIRFVELPTNDTWARDHAPLGVFENGRPCVYDFAFNGWGMKFAADLDNRISRGLFAAGAFASDVAYRNQLHRVLEGGGVESDGEGTLLTTESCLLSPNRNEHFSKRELDAFLRRTLGLKRILWLSHGHLAGDDTDGHVDTLARLCRRDAIAYVACDDSGDEHYDDLQKMAEELRAFRTPDGRPYELIPLPMADRVVDDGLRLPATYANFLILNGAVLVPTYGSPKDAVAIARLRPVFPDREVVGVPCSPLIKQHGSLHCVTMQYPGGFLK
jgi:agmatine/peptidylarginine deiminase